MARITQQSSIHTTGVSYENEPIIKSDAASSDVMEWAASTGSSKVEIREDASNNLKLDIDGVPVVAGASGSDGQGLHFAEGGYIDLTNAAGAEFGTSDFTIEFILDQDGDNTNDNYIYLSQISGNNRVYFYNDISANDIKIVFVDNSGGYVGTTYTLTYDMSADYGTPTHYALSFDRSGSVSLYKNAAVVATTSISGASAIDLGASNTALGRIGDSTGGYTVLGIFFRFRTWNKALTAAEVTTSYENATVNFAEQGAGEEKIKGVGTNFATACANVGAFNSAYNGSSAGNMYSSGPTAPTIVVASNAATITNTSTDSGNGSGLRFNLNATTGKIYRLNINVTAITGNWHVKASNSGWVTLATIDSTGAKSIVLPEWAYSDASLYLVGGAQNDAITITAGTILNSLAQIGNVADYDLAYANPTQSLTVQDRAGAADGTASASGVTQVTPIEQLNTKALSVGTSAVTPADGQIIAGNGLRINAGTLQLDDIAESIDFLQSGAINFDSNNDQTGRVLVIGSNRAGGTSGGTTHLTIDETGFVQVNGPVGTNFGDATSLGFELTSAGHQRAKVHSTSTSGHAVAYDLETGNSGPVAHTGSVKLSGGGSLSLQTGGSDRLVIDSAGKAGINYTPVHQLDVAGANKTIASGSSVAAILGTDGYAADVGGTLGLYGKFNTAGSYAEHAVIGGFKENALDGNTASYLVLGTRPASGGMTERLRIDSDGLATFSNGIACSGGGVGVNTDYGQIKTTTSVSITAGSSITISSSGANGSLVTVYEGGTGKATVFLVSYANVAIVSDPGSQGSITDVSNKFCMLGGGSHSCTLKNGYSTTKTLTIMAMGSGLS